MNLLQRQKWDIITDTALQTWINTIIWSILQRPESRKVPMPGSELLMHDQAVCAQVILHHQLHGVLCNVFGDQDKDFFGAELFSTIEADRRRTDIFTKELDWILGPQIGSRIIAIASVSMRRFYEKMGQGLENPRFIRSLTLWAPTLDTRDEINKLLQGAGYLYDPDEDGNYIFRKNTQGIWHAVYVKSFLWESSKNWSKDIEQSMWQRASVNGHTGLLELDATDLFILAMRHYSIDNLFGSAIDLLDLAMIVDREGAALDWDRLESIKSMFVKPYWVWSTFYALEIYEKRAGKKLALPDWARESSAALKDTFWDEFIQSRFNWANPDTRIVDFSKAYVKLTKG